MTVLFGAHGLAATLTADAGRGLIERMGTRAQATGPASRPQLTSTIAVDGVTFGVCELQYPGEPTPVRTAQAGPLLLIAQGRLDTRAELMELLGLPAGAHAAGSQYDTPSDTALILAAYQRFGIDCVDHLVGDWVFALWDAERKRLLLARDATGNSALFWWHGGGQLLFASSLQTLLAAGQVPKRPNPRWMAGFLTSFFDPAQPGATAFDDVYAVPPGHLVVAQGGRAELKRWWRPEILLPLDDTPLPHLQARFLALYEDAVRQQLRRSGGSVAATLSGGLDSGTVVALAAPMLQQQGQRLTAYVHTPWFDPGDSHPGRTGNEWALAQATARHVGHVDAVACPTKDMNPIEGMRRWLDIGASPSIGASNLYWLLDIAAKASASGARVLLTGAGGNATVSFNGSGNLWPRVRGMRLAQVVRELRGEEAGWAGALRDRLVKPALRPAWHLWKRAWSARDAGPPWSSFSLVRTSLTQQLRLREAMLAARHDPGFRTISPDRMAQFRLSLRGGAENGTAAMAAMTQTYGVDVCDPTRDQRVVELCWRLPDELFWSHGRQRGLVRTGMSTKLPQEVLACALKGLQSADLRQRLQACRDDLLQEVDAVAHHPLVRQWIDCRRLLLSANAALDEQPLSSSDVVQPEIMLRTLAAGAFIARHG